MKGYHNNHNQGKRRWRCLVIGVLFLVLLSMLVPLVFLLGLYHNGFHSTGHPSDPQTSSSASYIDQSNHVKQLIENFAPTLPKIHQVINFTSGAENKTTSSGSIHGTPAVPPAVPQPPLRRNNAVTTGTDEITKHKRSAFEESEKCELRFGGYCHWCDEHRESMKDFMVNKLKDQLFVARAYYPTIAKLLSQEKLTNEMRQNIQELERILSESSTDADLPPQIQKNLQKMENVIAKAKTFPVDCNNVDKKLRQILDLTEEETNFHMKQSAFLYQLAVQTMPKGLHCLSMRLLVEYFKSSVHDKELPLSERYSNPSLQHYVIFSTNLLAASVVINSTAVHARESGNLVFHVLTDGLNYFAMKLWFLRNTYKEAAVQVLNVENVTLKYHDKEALKSMSLPLEYRVSFHTVNNPPATHLRTEYVSVFSHTHYLIPSIFEKLKRVVVLDDDVVVQRDLSDLWNIDMGGKVNGALQLCSVRLGQLRTFLGKGSFDENSCAWMSGLNVIDLARWRELDLTKTYWKLGQEVSKGTGSTEAVALSTSLLTFQDLVYPLDGVWALSGLGHDYGIDVQAIKKAAVLHFNGQMKPWLELGIPKYKQYWKRFLNRDDLFLGECNVNP
ncbi:probable galacturonosyltransferase 7 [Populus alba]|uniref:Hexosyltransferase n=2 Tax=Populus TaxID=3689 RepID=A0A4U5QQW9_POPAL|nr:probable galacturonosyltransferase 7 [Populus alba]KAJ6993208.1 galacturonosyltransferase 7 [Populus alba x Populus x berolinensis]TKS13258.1 putative galacturonosyltransferase 7 isoform X1 [Populus alba]